MIENLPKRYKNKESSIVKILNSQIQKEKAIWKFVNYSFTRCEEHSEKNFLIFEHKGEDIFARVTISPCCFKIASSLTR